MARWNRMMRDHRFAGRHMMDGLDGELSSRQQARSARHVDECPACGPMLRNLIRMRAALRQSDDGDRSGDDADRGAEQVVASAHR